MIALFMPAKRTSAVDRELPLPFAEEVRSYIFRKASLSTSGSSVCINKEMGTLTQGFTCMIALLVAVLLHRPSQCPTGTVTPQAPTVPYRALVFGFPEVLSAHTKLTSKKHI